MYPSGEEVEKIVKSVGWASIKIAHTRQVQLERHALERFVY